MRAEKGSGGGVRPAAGVSGGGSSMHDIIKLREGGGLKGRTGGYTTAGRPGGVSGYPQACYRPFSRVRVPSSAQLAKFVGTFSCAQTDWRKVRERELATLDEKSTGSGIVEPCAR